MLHGWISAESPKETPIQASLASKPDISGTTFSFRRISPYDSTSPLCSPGPFVFASQPGRVEQVQGLGSLSGTTSPIISATALHLLWLGTMCYIAFSFDISEYFKKYCNVGALERVHPSLGMSERWVVIASLPCSRKSITFLWVLGVSAITPILSWRHSCKMQQDSKRAWTRKQEHQSGFLPLAGAAVMERPLGKGRA